MKIVFFIPRMGGGGAERVVANISNELAIRGYETTTPTWAQVRLTKTPGARLSRARVPQAATRFAGGFSTT